LTIVKSILINFESYIYNFDYLILYEIVRTLSRGKS